MCTNVNVVIHTQANTGKKFFVCPKCKKAKYVEHLHTKTAECNSCWMTGLDEDEKKLCSYHACRKPMDKVPLQNMATGYHPACRALAKNERIQQKIENQTGTRNCINHHTCHNKVATRFNECYTCRKTTGKITSKTRNPIATN